MDNLPVTRLEELHKHLDELAQNPDAPIDEVLFDHVELQLTEANIPHLMPQLLPKVAAILKTYRRDPLPLCSLAMKLLTAATFTQILTITSEDDIIHALRSPAPSAKMLALSILKKAAATPAETAILSASPRLVSEFLICWLSAPQVEVGESGNRTLIDLLDADCELPVPPPTQSLSSDGKTQLVKRKIPGHGKLWRRLFQDRDVLGLLVDLCEGKRFPEGAVAHLQRSLAQGRVLRVLPHLVYTNLNGVTRCDLPVSLPRQGDRGAGHDSFLHYAALRMVDRTDALMRMTLIDFFDTLVCATRLSEHSPYKVETIRGLLREAAALDKNLMAGLQVLPERVRSEEADAVRSWIDELMPPSATRLGS